MSKRIIESTIDVFVVWGWLPITFRQFATFSMAWSQPIFDFWVNERKLAQFMWKFFLWVIKVQLQFLITRHSYLIIDRHDILIIMTVMMIFSSSFHGNETIFFKNFLSCSYLFFLQFLVSHTMSYDWFSHRMIPLSLSLSSLHSI